MCDAGISYSVHQAYTFTFRRTLNVCNARLTIAYRSSGVQLTYTGFVDFLCRSGARRMCDASWVQVKETYCP